MENKKRIEFSVSEEKNLARFIVELEKAGTNYEVLNRDGGWVIVIKKGI